MINLLLYADNAHYFQSISATHLTVTENQIKCDLLRTMPNNERFRSADCDGVRFYFKLGSFLLSFIIYLDPGSFTQMGSRDDVVVVALASHQCGLGLIPARCHMRVQFVVGSRLALRVFLRVLRFSSLRKNQHLQIPNRPGWRTQ